MLSNEGYTHLCVVPCSFSKNLFNASINNKDLIEYVPCASEAVACSIAAGLKMSNKKPIVIVQSSGLTNLGSCITSLLVPYKIFFPIIQNKSKFLTLNVQTNSANSGYNYVSLYKKANYITLDEPEARLATQDNTSESSKLFKKLHKNQLL